MNEQDLPQDELRKESDDAVAEIKNGPHRGKRL